MPAKLQIFGVCRFAYPGLGGFQVKHDSVAEREAFLYAPGRIEARLRSFEHVCLRSVQIQTDPDFRFLVVIGESLPAPYRARLEALIAQVPQAELVPMPAMNQRKAMDQVINSRIDLDGPPVVQFRQDDDDGAARSFIARIRSTYQQMEGFWALHRRLCIDFNQGFYLKLGADMEAARVLRHSLGVAQALILEPSNERTVFHFTHHRIPTLMPTLTITDRPMWLRGVDGNNDSPIIMGKTEDWAPVKGTLRAELKQRFGLRPKVIQSSFSAAPRAP